MRLLENLDTADSLFAPADRLAFLLSGQSDYRHSELSREQLQLLDLVRGLGYATVDTGFPFNKAHDFHGCRRSGMGPASIRNTRQFLALLASRRYRGLVAKHLQPAFDASANLLILCQSCGLQMLQAAAPLLRLRERSRVRVVAFGPVAWGRVTDPRIAVDVVLGRDDWIAGLLGRTAPNHVVACGHLDYCRSPEVGTLLKRIIAREDHQGR